MSSCKSIIGRIASLAVLLIVSGCIQRSAPIETPSSAPPPRAIAQAPQPVYRTPPQAPIAPVRPAPVRPSPVPPFPRIGVQALPPPNPNPIVSNVGTPQPQAVTAAPRPVPRPPLRQPNTDIVDNPYKAFDPTTPPLREPTLIAEQELTPPTPATPPAPATPRNPVTYKAPPARASEDYASLIGDRANRPQPEQNAPQSNASEAAQTPPTSQAAAQNPTPAPAPAAGGKALVALLVPESDRRGSVKAIADGLAKAASLAAADINESRLELRKYDTGGDPRKAAQAAKNAIADGAKLIIGPLFSGSAAAVRPIAQSAGVNVIAFTTDQSVLGGGLYTIGFLPETDINRLISYAARRGQRSIALMVPDSPFGGVISRTAQSAAGRSGANIVKVQPFREDFKALDVAATDFATFYRSAPKVDSLVIATSGRTLQGLAAYLAFRDVLPRDVKFMGLGLWDDKETFREATLRGGWFPGVNPALKGDFNYRYGRAYGGEPPNIALLGYDAVAVAAALIRNGGFSRQALQSSSGFNGMSGLFRFRPDGRNDRALSILEVGQGSFGVVDPAPTSFSRQVSSLIEE